MLRHFHSSYYKKFQVRKQIFPVVYTIRSFHQSMRFLGQTEAQQLDIELMTTEGFSIDQLMELAGLSVASSVLREYPLKHGNRVLVVAGPGNNGGDGLVAARHLKHFGYDPQILYPKVNTKPLFQGLVTQCNALDIPFLDELPDMNEINTDYAVIVDAIFGFSFQGSIREPFDEVVKILKQCTVPIASVDIPSGWNVEEGNITGEGIEPSMLISLTSPKLCAETLSSDVAHYLGGRFVPLTIVEKFNLSIPPYRGSDQCVKLPSSGIQ